MDISPKQVIGKGSAVDISAIEQVKEEEGKNSRESLKNKLIDSSNDLNERRNENKFDGNAVLKYPDHHKYDKNNLNMLPFSLHESKN